MVYISLLMSYIILSLLIGQIFSATVSTVNIGVITLSSSSKSVIKSESEYVSTIIMALEEINNKSDGFVDDLLTDYSLLLSVGHTNPSYSSIINTSKYLLFQAFLNSGISFSLGSMSSKVFELSGKLLGSNNVLQFGWNSDAKFSYKSNYPYSFRTLPSDALQGKFLADLISSHFKWRKVGLFSAISFFGSTCSYEFRTRSAELGIQILSDIIFNVNEQLEKTIFHAKSSFSNIYVILSDSVEETLAVIQAGYNIGLFQAGVQIITTSFLADETSWQALSPAITNINQIMKGVITIAPDIDMTTERIQSFLARWRSRKDTITYNSAGKVIACSNRTDDDTTMKSYLFQSLTGSIYQCNGLLYHAFAANGSDMNPLIFYVYDAIYALSYALNKLIHKKVTQDINATNVAYLLTHSVFFEGLTGNVSFSTGLLNNQMYGVGDRRTGLLYRILNFQSCADSSNQFTSSCWKTIGNWQSEFGYQPCQVGNIGYKGMVCVRDITFNTDDNSKPLDWPTPIDATVPINLLIVEWICALVCILVVLGFVIMTIIYRHTVFIKAAQPTMLFVIHSGGMLAVCFIIITTLKSSNISCLTTFWLAHMSFDLVFGTLCLKTWRVYRLTSSGFRRVKITSAFMNNIILIAITCLAIYLMIASLLGSHNTEVITTTITNQQYIYITCPSTIQGYSIILYVKEAIMLLIGARLCWLVKDTPDALNESSNIALAIYVIVFLCLLIFPILFFFEIQSPDTIKFVKILGFTFALLTTMLSIFGSKALSILENKKIILVENESGTSNSMERYKSMERCGRDFDPNKFKSPSYGLASGDLNHSNSNIGASHRIVTTPAQRNSVVNNEFTAIESPNIVYDYFFPKKNNSIIIEPIQGNNNSIITNENKMSIRIHRASDPLTFSRRYSAPDSQQLQSTTIVQLQTEEIPLTASASLSQLPSLPKQQQRGGESQRILLRKPSDSLYHQSSNDIAVAGQIDHFYIPNRSLSKLRSSKFFEDKEHDEEEEEQEIVSINKKQQEMLEMEMKVEEAQEDSDDQRVSGCRSFAFDEMDDCIALKKRTLNRSNSHSFANTSYRPSIRELTNRDMRPSKNSPYTPPPAPPRTMFISHGIQDDISATAYDSFKKEETDNNKHTSKDIISNSKYSETDNHRKPRISALTAATTPSTELVGQWTIVEGVEYIHPVYSSSDSSDDDLNSNSNNDNNYPVHERTSIKSVKSTDALLGLDFH